MDKVIKNAKKELLELKKIDQEIRYSLFDPESQENADGKFEYEFDQQFE